MVADRNVTEQANSARRGGRRPAGERAMTNAERQAAYRRRQREKLQALEAKAGDTAAQPLPLPMNQVLPALPPYAPLRGSERQVPWAEEIRGAKIPAVEKLLQHVIDLQKLDGKITPTTRQQLRGGPVGMTELLALNVLEITDLDVCAIGIALREKASAHWWIEHRDRPAGYLLRDLQEEILAAAGREAVPLEDAQPDEALARAAALGEATISPETPNGDVIEISLHADRTVRLLAPGYRPAFNEIVKQARYRWNKPYWERTVERGLDVENVLVGTAHVLLARDYSVRIFDEALRAKVATGEYTPVSNRVIDTAKPRKKGQQAAFRLRWGFNPLDRDGLQALRAMRGSRVFDDAVLVPADHWASILDFAADYSFVLTDDAEGLVEIGQAMTENVRMITPTVRTADVRNADAPRVLDPTSVTDEIHADLLDA